MLEAVKEAGAAKLEASYSGGNDEGGVDDLKLIDADGKEMKAPDTWVERDPVPGDHAYRIRDGKVHDYHPLWEAADNMLSTEFGSWAGEFSAHGTLFADLKERKVWREGGIQSGYDDDSNTY